MLSAKKTKIIATIGPSSEPEEILEKLISLGIDGARLNFSHGSHQEYSRVIKLIRKIEKRLGRHIAIIADIQGPKIRVGNLPETGIELKTGQKIIIDTGTKEFHKNRIPLPSPLFRNGTKKGHLVFLDDGTLQIKITDRQDKIFKAVVLRGGILFSKKGVNVPSLEINSSIISAKDKADIKFSIKAGVDYIAISFLRNAADLKEARKFLGSTKMIAKIERHEALLNLNEITDEADAIMIARGDLGIETPLWELPVRQKEIIELARIKTKPTIVATQMLDSMIRNPMPTRAEVSDVANAVFDSTDAVMLSGETASGKYPAEAVDMMRKILEATDRHQEPSRENFQGRHLPLKFSVAGSAAHVAEKSNAKVIIVEASDEALTRAISHFRPKMPIVAVTKNFNMARRLILGWGIMPLVTKSKNPVEFAKKTLTGSGFLRKGDKVACVYNKRLKTRKIISLITKEII